MKYLSCEKDDPQYGSLWHAHIGNDWIYTSSQIFTPYGPYRWYSFDFVIHFLFLTFSIEIPFWRRYE
jgi:hypothetical protein